jgi:two-component system, cell cycle sensor histidine kinase and response regulator CckA
MTGPELAAELRAMHADLRVLYMSVHTGPMVESRLGLDASIRLVEKPFHVRDLLASVRATLDAC